MPRSARYLPSHSIKYISLFILPQIAGGFLLLPSPPKTSTLTHSKFLCGHLTLANDTVSRTGSPVRQKSLTKQPLCIIMFSSLKLYLKAADFGISTAIWAADKRVIPLCIDAFHSIYSVLGIQNTDWCSHRSVSR